MSGTKHTVTLWCSRHHLSRTLHLPKQKLHGLAQPPWPSPQEVSRTGGSSMLHRAVRDRNGRWSPHGPTESAWQLGTGWTDRDRVERPVSPRQTASCPVGWARPQPCAHLAVGGSAAQPCQQRGVSPSSLWLSLAAPGQGVGPVASEGRGSRGATWTSLFLSGWV